jgi:hypothetical protein
MHKSNLTTVISEGIGPSADAVLSALDCLPVIGVAVGLLKTVDDFRSRAMIAKLKSFIDGAGNISSEDIAAMEESFLDPDQKQTLGETLLLTLDSYTTLIKCELLGELFLCFLKKLISGEELRRMALAINGAFEEDLRKLVARYVENCQIGDSFLHNLALVGLAVEDRPQPGWDTPARGPMGLTRLGGRLVHSLQIIRQWKKEQGQGV